MKKKNESQPENFKSGYAAIIGAPNAGKSTLLNSIIDSKISIVSSKPQTTRFQIKGIYTDTECQIIFIDTPGIHKTRHRLGKFMVSEISDSIELANVILIIVDINNLLKKDMVMKIIDEHLNLTKNNIAPKILILNKTDTISNDSLFPVLQKINDTYMDMFTAIVPASAKKKFNLDEIIKTIKIHLTGTEKKFDDDCITDLTEKVYVSEIVREKIIAYTREEIPHASACKTIIFNEQPKQIYIKVMVFTERLTQKKIIIGDNAELIKKIGVAARKELEQYFDKKIFLELEVKTLDYWRENREKLKDAGYSKYENI